MTQETSHSLWLLVEGNNQNVMETNRYKYTIIVALALAHETAIFGREICKRITSRYGGCSQSEGTGYWAEDGDKDLTVYGQGMHLRHSYTWQLKQSVRIST